MMVLYRNLNARKLASDMNKTIEEGHVGRRLVVIDPPEMPLTTDPSRKLLLVASFIFALITASGSILALQLASQRVIGPHHLESIIGTAPLARVPRLRTMNEKINIRNIARIIFILVLIIATFAVITLIASMPLAII